MRTHPVFGEIAVHHGITDIVLPQPRRTVNVGSRKCPKEILAIYGGYDCETSTAHVAGVGWRCAVYMHQIALANDDICHVYLMRTWDEYIALLDAIIDGYNLSPERRIILWDANLAYEFAFLQHRLEWGDFFAKEELHPLLAAYRDCIEYRECLTISGGSLAFLAKNYCCTQKLKGDLDYAIARNYNTPLTDAELQYCINDVVILAEFSYYIFRARIIPDHKIPMTKTGIIVSQLKKDFAKMSKKLDKYGAHKNAYLNHIQRCYPDKDTYYNWFEWLFRGGYVHTNALYAAIDLRGVDMYDIKSSYPSVMLTDYVPVSPFVATDYTPDIINNKCCILYCTFRGIKIRTMHTIESSNKIIDAIGASYDNGRLIAAKAITVCLTEIDIKIYRMYYTWTDATVHACYTARRGKLPLFLRKLLVSYYLDKENLAARGLKNSTDYAVAKEGVNSMYGVCVKRIRLDKITYEGGEWKKIKNERSYDDEIKDALLLPQWGIWITAHARYALLSVVKRLDNAGVRVVYCDTDSIKYIRDDTHTRAEKIISDYNKRRRKHLQRRGYRQAALAKLGGYEKENNNPVRFKALGAKRYIYEDESGVHATIAGLPKAAIKNLGGNSDTIFAAFSDFGFTLAPEHAMKKTTEYTNTAYDLYIDGEWMHEESGMALYDIPFTLSLKDSYSQYITIMQDAARVGYVL